MGANKSQVQIHAFQLDGLGATMGGNVNLPICKRTYDGTFQRSRKQVALAYAVSVLRVVARTDGNRECHAG